MKLFSPRGVPLHRPIGFVRHDPIEDEGALSLTGGTVIRPDPPPERGDWETVHLPLQARR